MVLPEDSKITPRHYNSESLGEDFGNVSPMLRFAEWFEDAKNGGAVEPDAFVLSTFDGKAVNARTVALRGTTETGFLIYTNYRSIKAREMDAFPQVALTFYFAETFRQIRIKGTAKRVSEQQSDQYFDARPIGSKIGAWVSRQSEPLSSRKELEETFSQFKKELGETVSRPPFWGGYEIVADEFEFMQGQESRLHDRFVFRKVNENSFKCERLWP
jgi:pyridoxamine 5'-phosphate oxidase